MGQKEVILVGQVAVNPDPELIQAADVLKKGGCLVYPTETFYALGACLASPSALERIITIKGRPGSKPLPVIIGDMEQLPLVVAGGIEDWPGWALARRLMAAFWPGPLSIILPARPDLPAQVMDQAGMISVRLSPHAYARALCCLAQGPLTATSANLSGLPAVSRPLSLDQAIRMKVDAVVEGHPWPAGGMASTLVLPLGPTELRVLRSGALPEARLAEAGFRFLTR